MIGSRIAAVVGSLLVFLVGCDKKPGPDPEAKDPPVAAVDSGTAARPAAVRDAGMIVAEKLEVPEVRVRPNVETTVKVAWVTPSGTAVNDDAPFRVRWNRSDGLVEAPNDVKSTGSAVKEGFKIQVTPMKGAPNATLAGEINIVVCDSATHSVCVPVRRAVELGFVAVKDAAAEASVSIPLPAAK
jgi:hypothetical protein